MYGDAVKFHPKGGSSVVSAPVVSGTPVNQTKFVHVTLPNTQVETTSKRCGCEHLRADRFLLIPFELGVETTNCRYECVTRQYLKWTDGFMLIKGCYR